eukprot:NODE_154_length_1930_cov_368.224533.p9 GENE.NODE_154_length_1930_cov_368.224533~~NODE_154_length_1930_cov_368.224533.p9  ORF type:complete len:68 (+),score=2.13 NODE_154_length_1930_cov_368.224533:1526-1729(+)
MVHERSDVGGVPMREDGCLSAVILGRPAPQAGRGKDFSAQALRIEFVLCATLLAQAFMLACVLAVWG